MNPQKLLEKLILIYDQTRDELPPVNMDFFVGDIIFEALAMHVGSEESVAKRINSFSVPVKTGRMLIRRDIS